MDKETAIQIAKSKKSTPEQLKGLLGISDGIDLLLAKHPNTSAEMLDYLCEHHSFDEKICGTALAHPNISVEQLLNVGWEYPLAMFRNPALPSLMQSRKNLLGEFSGEEFENAFGSKELPGLVVDWLFTQGKAEYQVIFVSAPKRAPELLEKFRESKYPKVVATLLDKDVNSYLAWAKGLGLASSAIEQLAPVEQRMAIDAWVSWLVAKNQDPPAGVMASNEETASLPKVLVNALRPIEDLYFKCGRVPLSQSPNFYDEFSRLLQDALKTDATFSRLVVKVIDFDLGEVKRFGNPGRKAPSDIAKSSYYAKSGLEKSFNRLAAVLASWSGKQPEGRRMALSEALSKLVLDHPLPTVSEPAVKAVNVLPNIPSELLDEKGKFHISTLFLNPALQGVMQKDADFLAGFNGEEFEKILRSKDIPEFVVDWLASQGKAEYQAIFLFEAKRAPETVAKFLNSKHAKIVLQLLEQDHETYLAWATDLGFKRPLPDDDEPASLKSEIDDWVEGLWYHNQALWKELVPDQGNAATLQGELVRAMGRIEAEHFKNGMTNWGDGSGFYENFTSLIHHTLKAEKTFSKLVMKVIDADIGEIRRSGQVGKAIASGKKPREAAFDGSFLLQSDVERSHQRLGALITLWCQRHPAPVPVDGK